MLGHISVTHRLSRLITEFGYLSFGLIFSSDHRGMLIGLCLLKVGNIIHAEQSRRKLKNKNLRSIESYLTRLSALVYCHGLDNKLAELERHNLLSET